MLIASINHQTPITARRRRDPPSLLLRSFSAPPLIYILYKKQNFLPQTKHFTPFLRLPIHKIKHNNMANTLIFNGGGYKPAPILIKVRVRYYIESRRFSARYRQPQQWRPIVAWCLHQHFQFPNADIADLLHISSRTVIRDIQQAELYIKIYKDFGDNVEKLKDYILYNAKYIH